MHIKVWLSLGSNLGDRLAYLQSAQQALRQLSTIELEQSSIYESAPWGGVAQGPFLNQVISLHLSSDLLNVAIDTYISEDLISKYQLDSNSWLKRRQFIQSSTGYVQFIEKFMFYLLVLELKHDRNRQTNTLRWDSRTLDLDILAIQPLPDASKDIDSEFFHTYISQYLELPHPRISERQFILKPWCELASQLYIPSLGHKLSDLCKTCPNDDSLHVYANHAQSL